MQRLVLVSTSVKFAETCRCRTFRLFVSPKKCVPVLIQDRRVHNSFERHFHRGTFGCFHHAENLVRWTICYWTVDLWRSNHEKQDQPDCFPIEENANVRYQLGLLFVHTIRYVYMDSFCIVRKVCQYYLTIGPVVFFYVFVFEVSY